MSALSFASAFGAPAVIQTCLVDQGNVAPEESGKRTTLTSKEKTLLYAGPAKIKGFEDIPLGDPELDAAGETLFAIARSGVSTGALVAIDLRARAARKIANATAFGIVRSGQFAGRLLVYQRKTDVLRDPYYVYWLYSMDGRDLGMAGPDQLDSRWRYEGKALSRPTEGAGVEKLPAVGQDVLREHRLSAVAPVEPRPAAQRGTQDDVVSFAAVIDEEGKVKAPRVVSGDPALVAAARTAVERWRFRPFLVGGKASSVSAHLDVRFQGK